MSTDQRTHRVLDAYVAAVKTIGAPERIVDWSVEDCAQVRQLAAWLISAASVTDPDGGSEQP